jgi:hypothetical protein
LRPGADFLQFAVAFAQRDLATLRQGDWMNLREDFEAYIGQTSFIAASGNCIRAHPTPDSVLPSAVVFPLPGQYELHHFQALQQQVLALLQDESAETIPVGTMHPVAEVTYIDGIGRSTPGRRQLLVSGNTDACFLKILTWLLDQEPPRRILACPECHTLFYRHKLQAYCSRKCSTRVTVRNFRARQAEATLRQADNTLVSTGAVEKA